MRISEHGSIPVGRMVVPVHSSKSISRDKDIRYGVKLEAECAIWISRDVQVYRAHLEGKGGWKRRFL